MTYTLEGQASRRRTLTSNDFKHTVRQEYLGCRSFKTLRKLKC